MQIKMELELDEVTRGVTVHWYTDMLAQMKQPVWDEEMIKLAPHFPGHTPEQLMVEVKRRFPAGARGHISFLEDNLPANEEALRKLCLVKAPIHWLRLQERRLRGEIDTALNAKFGSVHGKVLIGTDDEVLLMTPAERRLAERA